MKKLNFLILILGFIIIVIIAGFFIQISGIAAMQKIAAFYYKLKPAQIAEPDQPVLEPLLIDKEGAIPLEQCLERGIGDKVVVLETKYCSACKLAVPRLKEIEKELNLEFMYFDLSKPEDSKKVKGLKIWPKYTPTVIIGCDVLIGAYSKDKYKTAIENFLNK